jgi:alpha-glucosidase
MVWLLNQLLTDLSASATLYVDNGFSNLSHSTVATNATSHDGLMYNLHNTWGYQVR